MTWAREEAHVSAYTVGTLSNVGYRDKTQAEMDQIANNDADRIEYLANGGWLDIGFFGWDEPQPPDYENIRYQIDAFRKNPGGDQIKWFGFAYHGEVWDGMIDHYNIFTPIDNDHRSTLSHIGASLLGEGQEAWIYWTDSAHSWIDSLGISNRFRPPKIQAFGGSGYATWNILQWWDESAWDYCDNPWEQPYTPWGNGALAYFYPPDPLGDQLPALNLNIVPTIRLAQNRDGVEDFEYIKILEDLVDQTESMGKDIAPAVAALAKARRQFDSPDAWYIGETYWLQTRDELAREITNLLTPIITKIEYNPSGDTVSISWIALPSQNYQLYYSETMGAGEQWLPVAGSYSVIEGIATQVFSISGGINKRFFKVKVL